MELLNKIEEQLIIANRRMKKRQRIVSFLAAVVVFVTTYALVLPAITLDKETASTLPGMAMVSTDTVSPSGGTVYEAVPESEPEQAEKLQEEESSGESEMLQSAEPVEEESVSDSESREEEGFQPAEPAEGESESVSNSVGQESENFQSAEPAEGESESVSDSEGQESEDLQSAEPTEIESNSESENQPIEELPTTSQEEKTDAPEATATEKNTAGDVDMEEDPAAAGEIPAEIPAETSVDYETASSAGTGNAAIAETANEIRLIEENTQLVYEYIDEEAQIERERAKRENREVGEDFKDNSYTVYADFDAAARLPAGVVLQVREITEENDPETYAVYLEKTLGEMQDKYDENTELSFARFYDIAFVYNGEEVEPAGEVKVRIEYKQAVEIEKETNVDTVHFDKNNDEKAEILESEIDAEIEKKKKSTEDTFQTVDFESAQFSVYGVVVSYTVDFEYSVDGKTYEFSLPGGGFVSLADLVEALGIAGDANDVKSDAETGVTAQDANGMLDVTASDAAKRFAADVESVEFSSPELVWVGKADSETTVGALKEENGLECEYSAELTEEQIAEIDAQTVEAGDWALISVQAFTSEESLTVTMKNVEQWTVKVTDAQITTLFLSDSGELFEVTVTYGPDAQIPDGATLKVTEFTEGSEDYRYAWKTVLADKQARDEEIDFSNLSALDISILDAEGNEIEPAAPVQVDLTIKSLPGVEDLSEVADTLAIQHHVETEDGIVVETVYDGGTEARFRMDTNEVVAAEGTAVDPDAADLSAFEFSSFDLYSDGSIVTNAPETEDDEIEVSFPTPVFSTFTVTWNNNSTTSNQLRVSQLSNGKYILYARDAANNNYYALVPGTALNSVQVTVNGDLVQYSGSENLYWDVETSGSGDNQRIYFSFTQNDTKYYLAAGTTGNKVTTNRNRNGYGNANTTEWRQWDNCIHSAGDTFLQSYNGTFRTWNVAGIYPFQDRSAVYFEKQGAGASNSSATIHYVDENGNELTVSKGSISSSTLLNNNAYLIYDIEGGEYEYVKTYLTHNSTNTDIRARLCWSDSRWQYHQTNGGNWTNISDGDDIYVVYKKKATPTDGGSPTLVELDPEDKPEQPTVTKASEKNGDGTNTISLSVTSHSIPREVLKLADVIVVFDVSGSMKREIDSENETTDTSKQRLALLKSAVNQLADDLIGDDSEYIYTDKNGVKHKQIDMSLITFSNTASNASAFTENATEFKGWVNNLGADGGTNWEQALQKANEAAVDSGRATFVIFVTDGDPTFRMTRMTDTDSSLEDDMYSNGATYYNLYNVYGTGSSDNLKDGNTFGRNYRAALLQAQSIVSKNKNLYMIGVGPDVSQLDQFHTDAGANGYFEATSAGDLTNAFESIKRSLAAITGYGDFQITDGITDLTNMVQKSTLVNYAEDDFTYTKERLATEEEINDPTKVPEGAVIEDRDGTKYVVWDPWNPASEGCALAVYNTETGAVVWNMGETFIPADGYTYQVRFKVWPSQEAYDLLATLNNSSDPAAAYAALDQSVKDQIAEPTTAGGMYTLKTNSDTSYNYKEATTVDGKVTVGENDVLSPAGTFDPVVPLELTTRPLKVKKQWHNNYSASMNPVSSITMELYDINASGQATQTYKTITLNEAGNWYSDDNYISYGLMTYNTTTNADEKVYETGHDFTLREVGINAHYFELTAGVYRPMFINGTPTILEKMDAAPAGMNASIFHYSDGTYDYYRLDGKMYRNTGSDILLIATNSRRSYMDLNKVVVDDAGNTVVDDTEFEYNIKFTVPAGIVNYDIVEKYIWFSVYDSVAGRTLSPSEYTYTNAQKPADIDSAYSDPIYANYLVATSGQQLTLKVKQGWNVRFLNLPIGTSYSFEETNIPTGYDFVKAEVSGTRWIADMVDGTDQGSAQTMSSLPSNTSGNNGNTDIGGTIDFANARYSTTYTNKTKTIPVNILKTSQDGTTPLPGAVFSLYTTSGYAADPKQAAKTDLTSDADGKIDLGKMAYGKYYLVETSAPAGYILLSEPVVITVAATGVTYTQEGSNLPLSGNGVIHQNDTDLYTLTVTNNAGYELPSTGGPGTRLFTILGSLLTLGAGVLLWRKRRFI